MLSTIDRVSHRQYVYRDVTEVHGQHRSVDQPKLWETIRTTVKAKARKEWEQLNSIGPIRWPAFPRMYNVLPGNVVEQVPRQRVERNMRRIRALRQLLKLGENLRKFITLHLRKQPAEPVLLQFDHVVEPGSECAPLPEFSLIVVPKTFTVTPVIDEGFTPLTLSCNYSVPKAMVAIIQVLYGTMEMYQSSSRQLPKFGYAAYSLTVIPYLIMSLVNLVATACEPRYPTMFLVLYGGESDPAESRHGMPSDAEEMKDTEVTSQARGIRIGPSELVRGAVGEAYGSLRQDLSGNKPFDVRSPVGDTNTRTDVS